jgi:hypothetical protein
MYGRGAAPVSCTSRRKERMAGGPRRVTSFGGQSTASASGVFTKQAGEEMVVGAKGEKRWLCGESWVGQGVSWTLRVRALLQL